MARKAKYRNKPTVIGGIRFASKREGFRYIELKQREREGKIEELVLQPRFPIEVNGRKVCTYIADFRYRDKASDREVVEDAKGYRTAEYKLKKKLLLAVHGIAVEEV